MNQCSLSHSSRNRPLNDSTYAFWFGSPASISRSAIPRRCAQFNVALPVDSGPLSVRAQVRQVKVMQ